jgi:hypothetical protein
MAALSAVRARSRTSGCARSRARLRLALNDPCGDRAGWPTQRRGATVKLTTRRIRSIPTTSTNGPTSRGLEICMARNPQGRWIGARSQDRRSASGERCAATGRSPDMEGPRRAPARRGPVAGRTRSPGPSGGSASTVAVASPDRPEPPGARRWMVQPMLAAWAASMAGRTTRISSIASATIAAVRAVAVRSERCCRMAVRRQASRCCFRVLRGISY